MYMKTNKDFEYFWYFEAKEELDFWMWCITNRPLLELLKSKSEINFDDSIKASKDIYASGSIPDSNLYLNTLTAAGFYEQSNRSEHSMYPILAEQLGGEVLGGANQPDCLINGIPLEAKISEFNRGALEQLKRYMQKYNSNFGLAAGKELTTDLPNTIFFVRMSFKEQKYVIENLEEAKKFIQKAT